ncbi:protein sprint isoform X2 [Schistocerca gregaria]|uniref:protein sprint isoform X2 n=1 Tax=Schistocerca gregaria TaxID=7010 RepID=UPI00211EA1B1|nr:protein sprint isoform X2 [Schistocerca gregaria]
MLITQYTALLLQSSRRLAGDAESGAGDAASNGLLEEYLPERPSRAAAPGVGQLQLQQAAQGAAPPTQLGAAGGGRGGDGHAATSSAGSLDRESASGSSCEGSVSHELDETEECDGDADEEAAACDIGLVERLIRTHPVWFLPGIQRAGAFHLLQGKEEGNFVVRQSSQPDTMAISVRLPAGKGPYIEHYLVQAHGGRLGLESSDNRFDNIPSLVAHYSQCCDELPVQLTLPRALREARNRQQLSSLALLGQEFWRYPMANPRPPEVSLHQQQHPQQQHPQQQQQQQQQMVVGTLESVQRMQTNTVVSVGTGTADQTSPSSASASSLSSFGSGSRQNSSCGGTPTSDVLGPCESRPVVLELAPLSPSPSSVGDGQPHHTLSTFKGASVSTDSGSPTSTNPPVATAPPLRTTRPTPPNTLNLVCAAAPAPPIGPPAVISPGTATTGGKTPPPPPPRWAKPSVSVTNNFTVTTTVTFSVNQNSTTPPAHVEVSCVQVTPKRPLSDSQSPPPGPVSSPLSPVNSPTSTTPLMEQQQKGTRAGTKKGGTRSHHSRQLSLKESHHYQESDILESPTVYYRSSVADKASDYEDIWGPGSSSGQGEGVLSTFRPAGPATSPFSSPEGGPPPDLLERLAPLTSPVGLAPSLSKSRLPPLVTNTGAAQPQVPSPAQSPSTPADDNPPPPKQGSPFYAEPADAVKSSPLAAFGLQRRVPQRHGPVPATHRHSDPAPLVSAAAARGAGSAAPRQLQRIDSSEELALSADDVRRPWARRRQGPVAGAERGGRGRRAAKRAVAPASAWALDSSWEFIVNDDDGEEGLSGGESEADDEECTEEPSITGDDRERRFPSLEQQENTLEEDSSVTPCTVHDLIIQRFPSLRLSPDPLSTPGGSAPPSGSPPPAGGPRGGTLADGTCSRVSSYDNVENGHRSHTPDREIERSRSSHQQDEDTLTEFSEPWDSSRWECLLGPTVATGQGNGNSNSNSNGTNMHTSDRKENGGSIAPTPQDVTSVTPPQPVLGTEPLLSPPRLHTLRSARALSEGGCGSGGGAAIRAYALHLAADRSTTFAQNVDNFIACTRESRETSPQVVMRNMRQFMSGMKNYLVKHGEREFEKEVEKERVKLRANEFLNLDAILEGVMQRLVVRPLRDHVYRLFVDDYGRRGEVRRLASAIMSARSCSLRELGVRAGVRPPTAAGLATVTAHLSRLQSRDLPLDKLAALLDAVASIFTSVKAANAGRSVMLTADDFLPLLVWVLVQAGMVAAEIEADLMWGLLQPSLLSGEAGYYLTALSSAVHVLKSFRRSPPSAAGCPQSGIAPEVELQSVLKVVVPDEVHGSIITKTLPVRPHMTTREVCKIIAHKVRITNPQDYGLFKLVDGEETLLADSECPQDVRGNVTSAGKHCMFAYKRIDAKIAWPRTS